MDKNNELNPDLLGDKKKIQGENFNLSNPEIFKEHISEQVWKSHGTEVLDEVVKIPPFPVEVFPPAIQQIIHSTNESLNFPVDFIGAAMIYAASIAIGNTTKVQVKEGWFEFALLYLALVGRPNTNKSHPLTFALQPIINRDKKTFREFEIKRKEFEHSNSLTKKERNNEGVDEPVKPFWQKSIVSDITPEALAQIHFYNKRGIAVYMDELAGWFKNFNRYNKGNEQQFWLSNWNCKEIYVDRKSGDPIFISSPFITVAGTIQTGILNTLTSEGRGQDGFFYRMLFAFPQDLKKPYWSEKELPKGIIENWETIIESLVNIPLDLDENFNPQPQVVKFSPDALRVLKEWQVLNTDLCNNAESEAHEGIHGKFEFYVIRFSLILEMLKYACGESDKQLISCTSIRGAISLVDYFRATTLKVHTIISNYNPLDNLPVKKITLYEALPEHFTTAEGLLIATSQKFPERSFKRFLNDKELFRWLKQGEYEKRL